MIYFTTGDIFLSGADALVNPVNCVGVMGKGLALQFKSRFPANFAAYRTACGNHQIQPGRMFVFETTSPRRLIVNFPTKRHWRDKSRIADIQSGLHALTAEIRTRHIRSIAIPPLGCGLGGLDWSDVRRLIEAAFRNADPVDAILYEPSAASSR